jgi:hypothetical protein
MDLELSICSIIGTICISSVRIVGVSLAIRTEELPNSCTERYNLEPGSLVSPWIMWNHLDPGHNERLFIPRKPAVLSHCCRGEPLLRRGKSLLSLGLSFRGLAYLIGTARRCLPGQGGTRKQDGRAGVLLLLQEASLQNLTVREGAGGSTERRK